MSDDLKTLPKNHTYPARPHFPKLPQTLPVTGTQMCKHINLWEIFFCITSHTCSSKVIPEVLSFTGIEDQCMLLPLRNLLKYTMLRRASVLGLALYVPRLTYSFKP